MTDRYENIRKALVKGLTPGPWGLSDGRTDTIENDQGYSVCTVHWHPDERYCHGVRAAYIAACDPDTIRALLAEMDALRELEERKQRDEALLRQALEALELRCGTNAEERNELIPALRERLGEKA